MRGRSDWSSKPTMAGASAVVMLAIAAAGCSSGGRFTGRTSGTRPAGLAGGGVSWARIRRGFEGAACCGSG